MAPPVAVSVLLVEVVLVAALLVLFLPDPPPVPRRRRDVERLVAKYGPWFVPVALVLIAHVLELQLDLRLTERLGYDLAPALLEVEAPLHERLARWATPAVGWAAAAWYLLVHPALATTAMLLFVLTDEERAAKAALLALPIGYVLALPILLFAPATTPTLVTGGPSPLVERFPDFAGFWFGVTTPDNTLPAFQVAVAFLVWNASRYSRNRRFRLLAGAHAVVFPAAALLTGVHYATGVLAAAIVAALAALYIRRIVDVERLALKKVKPSPERAQLVQEDGAALVEHVAAVARRLGVDASPMLVGSVAKDTYLRDKVDYDVFVLFPPETPRAKLEEAGLAVGHAALDEPVEKYAEHPYVHGRWRNEEADVVPAYRLDHPSERMTAVDRTPFHTRYVLGRMEREQRDETRLLKAFLTGIGAYGAEARTRGFSGYLCELLVLKYGRFADVVAAGARWKPGTVLVVDPVEGVPRFKDPLVVLDPVDPRRNAASAVAEETLVAFSEACRAYLVRPGLNYFSPRPLVALHPETLRVEVRRRKADLVLVTLPRPGGVLEDHLHDQVRRAARVAGELLERHDFEPRRTTTELGEREVRILVELRRLKLSEGMVHAGPPVDVGTHAARFREQWTGNPDALSEVYVEDARLKVKRRRPWRRADDLLRAELPRLDVGKHLHAVTDRMTVESGPEVVREDTAQLLTRHLDRRRPWER